nr:unnamed protein product [Callosobruchus analis]
MTVKKCLKIGVQTSSTLLQNQTGPSTSHKKCFSVQKALALYLDLDLSENNNLTLSSTLNALHPGLFLGLYKLRQYKKTIAPINVVASEPSTEAHLQDLLNTTTKSIIETVQPDSLENVSNSLTLVSKWEFDGSSGHSPYKQKFTDTESTDEFLMLTAFVPLKLIDNRNRKEVWKNPRPSSTLFCRPIRFQYIKECKDVVKAEEQTATSDIEKLQQFKVIQSGQEIFAKYEMLLTMLHGSAISTLSGTNANQNCFIRGATTKTINRISIPEENIRRENYKLGLSSLHCWIKSFETHQLQTAIQILASEGWRT